MPLLLLPVLQELVQITMLAVVRDDAQGIFVCEVVHIAGNVAV
jgi:hypothetical protein